MSKRGVGLLLILTAAIALGALVQDFRFDRLIATEQSGVSAFNQHARDFDRQIDRLDVGSAAVGTAEIALNSLRSAATDAPTIASLDSATAAFAKLKRGENNGSAQNTQDVHDAIAKAIVTYRDHANSGISQVQMLRLVMNGVALIFTLAVAVYLGRVATVLGVRETTSTAQMLRDLPPPVKAGAPANGTTTPSAVAPVVAAAPVVAPQAQSSASTHRPSANLAAAAELCVDLAKVLDADDVPVLLERAALVLDARGIVLWGIDSDGIRLQPSLCYGYPDRVLARLRPLQIDADNVTSLAFRSAQSQMMTGASTTDPAALAIPLLTGGGCVGVMAVELRHNRPHADLLPVARILSAQFSTLVAPAEDLMVRAAK